MLEDYKVYLTKKNIILLGIILICMILILYISLNMIFPTKELTSLEKGKAKSVIENFIKDFNKKKEMKIEKYMVKGWKPEDVKNLFIGYDDLENLTIENIKNDTYSKYCEKYEKNKKLKGEEGKYTSFTVDLNHNYKDKGKYKDESKKIVFLMEKNSDGWRIITLGTQGVIDSLI